MPEWNLDEITVETIVTELKKLHLDPVKDTDCGGQRLDLLVATPNDLSVAIELKRWKSLDDEAFRKGEKEVDLLLETCGVDYALIVIPTLPDGQQTDRMRNLEGVKSAMENLISLKPDFSARGAKPKSGRQAMKSFSKRIFVAMPFAARFEDTYYLGILPAAQQVGALCDRVDGDYLSQKILDRIYTAISNCDLVIADLSGLNPNVTYELGYAHALKKPAIHLASTPPEELPFDLRQWSTIIYAPGQVYRLRNQLEVALKVLLGEDK